LAIADPLKIIISLATDSSVSRNNNRSSVKIIEKKLPIEDSLGLSHTAQQQQHYNKKWRENEECRVAG
jgi:hypothetical protein